MTTPALAPEQVACPHCSANPGQRCLPDCTDPEERGRFAALLAFYDVEPCCVSRARYTAPSPPRPGIVTPTRTFQVSAPFRGGPWMRVTYFSPQGASMPSRNGDAQIQVAVPHRSLYRTSIRSVPQSTVTAAMRAFCVYREPGQVPQLLWSLSAATLPLVYDGGAWDGKTKAQRMFDLGVNARRLGLDQLPDGRWGCAGAYESYPGQIPGSALTAADDLVLRHQDTAEGLPVLWPYLTATAMGAPRRERQPHP